jgi:hypothetical protein
MMAAPKHLRLIERLPKVRGALRENASLAATTWFRVGGPAEVLFRPADRDDLAAFLAFWCATAACPASRSAWARASPKRATTAPS